MKILVCGGRDYTDYERFCDVMEDADCSLSPTVIVQGGARGADRLAMRWAKEHDVACITVDADWDTHGRAAGVLRNQRMLDEHPDIDQVIAFPGGRGTEDMVLRAMRKRLNIWVVG